MPVSSLSRCCICCNTSLPCRAMRRKSSSSADTPSAITPPFCIWLFAGSGYISRARRSRTSVRGLMLSAIECRQLLSVDSSRAFSISTAVSEFLSCTNSRGRILPAAMRDERRSRSPIAATCSRRAAARSASVAIASTTS